jgi:hypothetical protein
MIGLSLRRDYQHHNRWYCQRQETLLCFESSHKRLKFPEELPGNGSLEATTDLLDAFALGGPPCHVFLRRGVELHPRPGNRVQRLVQLPVAVAVEPMPGGLRGCPTLAHRQLHGSACRAGGHRPADAPLRGHYQMILRWQLRGHP